MPEAGHHTDDIGKGVQGPDLVEVHFLGWHPVHATLRHREALEHRESPGPHRLGQRGVDEQSGHVGPRPGGRGLRREHVDPGGTQPVPGDRFRHETNLLHRQRGDRGGRHVEWHSGIDERAEQHVARRPRREIQPADGHPRIIPSTAPS